MHSNWSNGLVILALSMICPGLGNSSDQAIKNEAPANYTTVPDLTTLQKRLQHTKNLAVLGQLDSTAILADNTHGATMAPGISSDGGNFVSHASGITAVKSAATASVTPPTLALFNSYKHVRYWGREKGFIYFEAYGDFQTKDLDLECGLPAPGSKDLPTPITPDITYFSDHQLNFRLPSDTPFSSCVLLTKIGPYSSNFYIPKPTCAAEESVCDGKIKSYVDVTDSLGSRRVPITILGDVDSQDFQDLHDIKRLFTDYPYLLLQLQGIKQIIVTHDPKSAPFKVQFKAGDLSFQGTQIGYENFFYAVAGHLYEEVLKPGEAVPFTSESEFDHYYAYNWMQNGANDEFVQGLNAAQKDPAVLQQALVIGSVFYDPQTKGIHIPGPYYTNTMLPVSLTSTNLKIGDVTFRVNGNTIVSGSQKGGPSIPFNAPITIPSAFLRLVQS